MKLLSWRFHKKSRGLESLEDQQKVSRSTKVTRSQKSRTKVEKLKFRTLSNLDKFNNIWGQELQKKRPNLILIDYSELLVLRKGGLSQPVILSEARSLSDIDSVSLSLRS